jgi:hypothetical protein
MDTRSGTAFRLKQDPGEPWYLQNTIKVPGAWEDIGWDIWEAGHFGDVGRRAYWLVNKEDQIMTGNTRVAHMDMRDCKARLVISYSCRVIADAVGAKQAIRLGQPTSFRSR